MTRIPGMTFLASHSARSRAYAQAMAAAGLAPERVLLFGDAARPLPVVEHPDPWLLPDGLFVPDLSVPVGDTCAAQGWEMEAVPAGSVNDPAVVARLRAIGPELVLYSGYGGQIVGADALSTAPFLHLHAGWLPEERGSTTIYYGILAERRCAVSAILLAPEIDAGPILARKRYPCPAPGVEIDYLYDNAIRADLLVEVLRRRMETGALPAGAPQGAQGSTYYVIHPVLKHLAVLSLERAGSRTPE